jgi:homoserine kinase
VVSSPRFLPSVEPPAVAQPKRKKKPPETRERLMEQTNASLALALGGAGPSWQTIGRS